MNPFASLLNPRTPAEDWLAVTIILRVLCIGLTAVAALAAFGYWLGRRN